MYFGVHVCPPITLQRYTVTRFSQCVHRNCCFHTAHTRLPQAGPYFSAFDMPTGGESGGVPSGSAAYYSLDIGSSHVVVLDSSEGRRLHMQQWLKQDLEAVAEANVRAGANTYNGSLKREPTVVMGSEDDPAAKSYPHCCPPCSLGGLYSFYPRVLGVLQTTQWLIAVVHAAPYSKGSEDSDLHPDQTYVREVLVPALEAAGLDLLLSGHSHSYERSRLMRGHYGLSRTWDEGAMLVNGHNGSNGVAYRKHTGLRANSGFVAVVAGSSGTHRIHAVFFHVSIQFEAV